MAEGDLTAAEQASVQAWLANQPDAAEELTLYRQAPHLEADPSVNFGGVVPGVQKRSFWAQLGHWTAAAAVVAALMLPVALNQDALQPVPLQVADAEVPTPVLIDSSVVAPQIEAVSTPARRAEAVQPAVHLEAIAALPSPLLTDEVPATDPLAAAPPAPDEVPLFVLEEEQPLYVEDMIVVEGHWSDPLRIILTATHEQLGGVPYGDRLGQLLPDGEALASSARTFEQRVLPRSYTLIRSMLAFNIIQE